MNGAETLLRTARNAGIDVCFANPGTPGIRPVLGGLKAPRDQVETVGIDVAASVAVGRRIEDQDALASNDT
jgi:hypothetical protein